MKNKRLLAFLAVTAALTMGLSACGFGGDEPLEQVVVETTPTPEPTATPAPVQTIAPDVQNTTYTSQDKTFSMELPDATWANKTSEENLVSFESPEQGKIVISHGVGEEDMSSILLPTTQDTAVALEQAAGLTEGTDFTIKNFSAENVNGVNVYSYRVKYNDPTKSGGYAQVINKVFANDQEYFTVVGSLVSSDKDVRKKVNNSIKSFQILGDSTLSGTSGTTGETGDGTADGTGTSSAVTDPSGNISDAAMTDTNQTRTIYRNSDGAPRVITSDGNGGWTDSDGNTFRFADNNIDVYDQNDVDYYYHGEAADVYYMPVDGSYSYDSDDSGSDSSDSSDGSTMTTTAAVNVRDVASNDSEVIGGFGEGEQVTVLGWEGDWVKVDYYGQAAYVHSSLLY